MAKSSTLSLTLPSLASNGQNIPKSSPSPRSPRSPPLASPTFNRETQGTSFADAYNDLPSPITSLPVPPKSPTSPKLKKESTISIFSSKKASKSSSRIPATESSIRQVPESDPSSSSAAGVYGYRRKLGSTPDLNSFIEEARSSFMEEASIASVTLTAASSKAKGVEDMSSGRPTTSDSVPHVNSELPPSKKNATKHRFPQLLGRTRSVRDDNARPTKTKPSAPNRLAEPEARYSKHPADLSGLKTAPLKEDRSFRDMMNSTIRNRSADRHAAVESEDDSLAPSKEKKDAAHPSSLKESSGASFLSNIRHSSTKAADGIGKAGKGIFTKFTRSGSSNEREMPAEENYICNVINLPLVEQTRRTRISKRLEHCRDKTEFWMPALPWRCIDYLNMKGSDQEGLYRVPGSGREIKHWQMRFDRELDIDLFNEPDLYDINIIGSMFKTWLRELPDEIFPTAIQAKIAKECAGATQTPQLLKDELSSLPPYNYYLLFAITCHISLLHSCSKENKMDYRNLCICFQPCMKIDAFCFQWLVLDWRNCWQGCRTEKEYLKMETDYLSSQPRSSTSQTTASSVALVDERAVSSSGSSKPSMTGSFTPEKPRPLATQAPRSDTMDHDDATPTQAGQPRLNSDLPALSPMKPLSPIGPL